MLEVLFTNIPSGTYITVVCTLVLVEIIQDSKLTTKLKKNRLKNLIKQALIRKQWEYGFPWELGSSSICWTFPSSKVSTGQWCPVLCKDIWISRTRTQVGIDKKDVKFWSVQKQDCLHKGFFCPAYTWKMKAAAYEDPGKN